MWRALSSVVVLSLLAALSGGVSLAQDNPPVLPAACPDGGGQLFFKDSAGKTHLIYPDGTGFESVGLPNQAQSLAFSADGLHLAYHRTVADSGYDSTEIYLIDVDAEGHTSNRQQMTFSRGGREFEPMWSPDAAQIAYVVASGDTRFIVIVDAADAQDPGPWPDVPQPGPPSAVRVTYEGSTVSPDWSRDGTRFVFVEHVGETVELFTMQVDGSDPAQITTNDVRERDPAWSPDGTRIAYVEESERQIYVLDLASGDSVMLPGSEEGATAPSWSPDGAFIAFAHAGDVFIAPVEGGEPVMITGDVDLLDRYGQRMPFRDVVWRPCVVSAN